MLAGPAHFGGRAARCPAHGAHRFHQHQAADDRQKHHIGELDDEIELTEPPQKREEPFMPALAPKRPPISRTRPSLMSRDPRLRCAIVPDTEEATTWLAPVATATFGGTL